jgi:chemotaxis signal transduction protein
MRAFVFNAAGTRFAIDARVVEAVHPLVRARPVAGGPPWLAGAIDVHGELVPMVDAASLLAGGSAVSRILLIDTGIGEGTRARFALAVDRVAEAAELDLDAAWGSGALGAPWLGAVIPFGADAVQRFEPAALAIAHAMLAGPADAAPRIGP